MSRSLRPRRRRFDWPGSPQLLEARVVPAIFTVTSTADSGSGTLREAIDLANAAPDFDEIHFNISPGVPILLSSSSPDLVVDFPTLIDGYTQPGSQPNTASIGTNAQIGVQLSIDTLAFGTGLTLRGNDITVRGLNIGGFVNGIQVIGTGASLPTNVTVAGNFLTVNDNAGILVSEYSSLTIGGAALADRNLISANNAYGIQVEYFTRTPGPAPGPSENLHVANNLIGTDQSGNDVAEFDQPTGISISDVTSVPGTAGVDTLIEDNVIGAYLNAGIHIAVGSAGNRSATTGTVIRSNRIGAQAGADAPLDNSGAGILIEDQDTDYLIGGPGAGDGNFIAFNDETGVRVVGSTGTTIQGNRISFNGADGDLSSFADRSGVYLFNSPGNLVADNVIEENGGAGVKVQGASGNTIRDNDIGGNGTNALSGTNERSGVHVLNSSGNLISGNDIGDNGTAGVLLNGAQTNTIEDNNVFDHGTTDTPNVAGIYLFGSSTGNTLQGNTVNNNDGDGVRIEASPGNSILQNTINGNGGSGVLVDGSAGVGIRENSIFNNGDLGIDIINPDDTSFPNLTSVINIGPWTLIEGILPQTQAGVVYQLEFFRNAVPDPSGFGEGETFLLSVQITGAAGSTPFSLNLPLSIPVGSFLTATATDTATGRTSEFSNAEEVIFVNPLIVTNTNDEGLGSLRFAIEYANTVLGPDTITFAIPGQGPHVIAPLSPLPSVVDIATINASSQPGSIPNSSATGFNGTVAVVLSGSNLAGAGNGLALIAAGSSVSGMSIVGFAGAQFGLLLGDNTFATGLLVGLNPGGAADPNGIGVIVQGANARLGGPSPAERNVISGNSGNGISLSGPNAVVTNNLIGVGFDGSIARPNGGSGIGISANGAQVGPGNVIASNAQDGVSVVSGVGNSILDNSIIANGGLGIRLAPGANADQPAPGIDLATPDRVFAHLAAAPNTSYLIQFFSNAVAGPDAAEGQALIGQLTVTTGPSGYVEFSFVPTALIPIGRFITATATATGSENTSPFSNAEEVIEPFIVVNTNDDGRGSLRRAMELANFIPGFNTIIFAIPGPGPHTIFLASPLPAIGEAVDIDASTQPGFAGTPVVAVDGSEISLEGGGTANGFTLNVPNTTLRSLAIGNFSGFGVILQGSGGNRLLGNFIGTDTSGSQRRSNDEGGVFVNNSANNLIEGNLISGNGISADAAGVDVRGPGATNNVIRGNVIGLARDGEAILGNTAYGVFVGFGAGATVIDGNVISGNGTSPGGAGIFLSGRDEAGGPLPVAIGGHRISNNLIGTNASGNRDATNAAYGVVIDDLPNNVVTNNTISGHAFVGLLINNTRAQNNLVTFNRIGTDATAQFAIPNGSTFEGRVVGDGIDLANAPNNRIGGNGLGNIIAGNLRYGVYIFGPGSAGNQVDANLYGRGSTNQPIPNGQGDIARQRNDRAPTTVQTRSAGGLRRRPANNPGRTPVRPRNPIGGRPSRPFQSARVTPRFSN